MAISLLEEIIFYEILSRFSVKFLIRLTLVCRRWLSLITKPGPINSLLAHTSLNLHNSKSTSIVVRTKDYFFCNYSDITVLHNNDSIFYNINDSVVKICDQIFRNDPSILDVESYPPVQVKLIDSVNGLVCFTHNHARRVLFLWNPVTNFFRTVLIPSSRDEILSGDSALFYDTIRGDMKIMHMELLCCKELLTRSIRVHVYSCNAESWKEVKDETLPVKMFMTLRSVKSRPNYAYVHFWSSPVMLTAFDFYDEVFKQLPSPKPHSFEYYSNADYINWMDSLGMVGHDDSGKRVIYTLDDISGTWYEKHVVPKSLTRYELIVCLSNGDIVCQDEEKNLYLLEADQGSKFKTLIDLKPERIRGRFEVIPYTETLLCIKGMQELNI